MQERVTVKEFIEFLKTFENKKKAPDSSFFEDLKKLFPPDSITDNTVCPKCGRRYFDLHPQWPSYPVVPDPYRPYITWTTGDLMQDTVGCVG